MLDYRTTQSSRRPQPTNQPNVPRACGRRCDEWLTEWWMPRPPSANAALIGTESAARERATTAVARATSTIDKRTERVDRATGSVDKRTDTVDPCTETVHRRSGLVEPFTTAIHMRTAAVAGSKAAQHLRGGLQPSSPTLARALGVGRAPPVLDAQGRRPAPEQPSEVRHYRGVPFTCSSAVSG